jgi:hypothetical protein
MVDTTGADSGNLSFASLEEVWEQAGGSSLIAPVMAAIALAESSGNPNALNPDDNNGTQTSWGLWQISLGNHNEPSPEWNQPLENAKLAVQKLQTQGLSAWGTYTSGKYEQYLPNGYIQPEGSLPGINGATGAGQGAAGVQATGNTEGSWTSALGDAWSDVTNGLFSWPGVILGTFDDLDKAVSGVYQEFQLFFRPSTYVRVGAGFAGVFCLIVAVIFMAKEAK